MSSNPAKKIYISYAHKGNGKGFTDSLDNAFQAKGVSIVRDIKAVKYRESFKHYMKELGAGDYIIVVVDKCYLESHNCMFELMEVYKNKQFRARIYPLVLPCAGIYDVLKRVEYITFWEEKVQKLDAAINNVSSNAHLQGIREELDLYSDIRHTFATIADILTDMNARSLTSHEAEDYKTIFEAIQNDISKKTEQTSAGSNKKIRNEDIFLCNRRQQNITFGEATKNPKKVNAFYIHGDNLHGHEEMFKRFCNDLKGCYDTKDEQNRRQIREIPIEFPTIIPSKFRITLLRKFLDAIGINLHQYTESNLITDEKFHRVCRSSNYIKPLSKCDIVAFEFRIHGGEWFAELPREIEWFIDNFCNTELLPDDTPDFYFFFSVVYSRANFLKRPIQFRKLKQHKDDIIQALSMTSIPRINELSWVKKEHIEHWLSVIRVDDDEEKQRLMKIFFRKKHSLKGYYMSKLKPILTAVINDHVNNKL